MTRDEFIDGYMKRSGIPSACRTPDGYAIYQHPGRIALRCDCGEQKCMGWAMVSNDPESIATHNELYSPNAALGDRSEK